MDYRHELKFLVSDIELEKIKYRLLPIMDRDPNIRGDSYTVRSLYFDDVYDSCYNQVLAGVTDRKKFRLRLYNGDSGLIHLEKKSKHHSMTRKISETVSEADCRLYMAGLLPEKGAAVWQELFAEAHSRGMKPCCIVEYDRDAYVEALGNVRITFDRDVRGCMEPERFLEIERTDFVPAMPEGMQVLEVKYDQLLPKHILQALDLNCLLRQSISKYAYVRDTEINRKIGAIL